MIFRIAMLVIPLLLTACATPMRVTMTPEQRAKVGELKAHVIVVQDEVIAAVQPSNVSAALGGGLIGAMIDSSVTNTRVKASQQIMGPFYATIEDVDYRKEFNETVRRELGSYPIKIGEMTTTPRMLNLDELNQMREKLSPGQALLVIVPHYTLTMDFRNLDAEATVTMWVKGEGNTPIQRGVLRYQSQAVGIGGKPSVDLWGANNAALFKNALRESISELMKMILVDIDLVQTPAKPEELKAFSFNSGVQQIDIKGRAMKDDAKRVLVLGEDGKLYSLPKSSSALAQR